MAISVYAHLGLSTPHLAAVAPQEAERPEHANEGHRLLRLCPDVLDVRMFRPTEAESVLRVGSGCWAPGETRPLGLRWCSLVAGRHGFPFGRVRLPEHNLASPRHAEIRARGPRSIP